MKTLHQLVQDSLRDESTTENRYEYVNYYLEMIMEMQEEMHQMNIQAAEAMAQNPFAFFDDELPF